MTSLPKSRLEAASLGRSRYHTGKPCKYGHVAERKTCNGNCSECDKKRDANRYRNNHARLLAQHREYYYKNREEQLEYRREYRRKNPEKFREWHRKWLEENPEKERERAARRRATKAQRTPAWVSRKDLQVIYTTADRVSRDTGEKHHVDHIYPLRGEFVSGLHVPHNLQILTAEENLKKYNKMPDKVSK